MFSRLRALRSVAATLVVAIASIVSANCLAASAQTAAERACCAAMAHHCGEAAVKADCCGERSQGRDTVAALSEKALSAPVPVLVAILEVPAAMRGSSVAVSNVSVKPPGTPTYVLVSAFRI
jgi:hypothetical protein